MFPWGLKGVHCVPHICFFRHQEETIHFYLGKLRKETCLSVESVDGIVPCHLHHKKESTPLEFLKMGRVETLKTLPQQLASHKKNVMFHTKQEHNENVLVALRHGLEAFKPQLVLDYSSSKKSVYYIIQT